MTKNDHGVLDWTVADAPAETEAWPAPTSPLPPPPPRPTPMRRWELPRRAWLMLAATALLAVLVAAFGLPRLEQYRARRAVEQVIASETAAIRDGEWETLRSFYDPEEPAWVANEIRALKVGGQPLVLNNFSAYPPEPGGTLRWVRVLAPELAQAQIDHVYQLADGTTATLGLAQFYRYTDGAWRRTPPPDDWWGETRQWHGIHVDLEYPAADAYATELGAYLDGLAVQACARWQCAADTRVPVKVVTGLGGIYLGRSGYSRIDSLVFSLLSAGEQPSASEALLVPSQHIAGHPQDEATLALMRKPLAVRLLLRLARQAQGPSSEERGSLFFYALLARHLADLGLERAALGQLRVATPLYSLEKLWSDSGGEYTPDAALTQALVMLNHLLDGQSPATEAVLLRTVRGAPDAITWLAAGLGLSPAEVERRVAAALYPPVPLAAADPDRAALVMQCDSGPWLATLDGQAWPLLEGHQPSTWAVSWSPDGQRLALIISGRPAVLDLATGTGTWLPQPRAESGTLPQWVSDTVVAYEAMKATAAIPLELNWSENLGIHFYDAADPGRQLAPLPEVHDYWVSPDKTRAVAMVSGVQGGLAVIPALGGEPVHIGGGSLAQWSPDSTQIAFMNQDSSGRRWSLRLADADTGEYRTLLAADDPRVQALDLDPEAAWAQFAWSPRGDQIAVYLQSNRGSRLEGWMGLLSVDGASFRPLLAPEPGLTLTGPSFSADGRTLAVSLYSSPWERRMALYDVNGAAWLRTLPEDTSAHWSQPGSSLIVTDDTGTYRMTDPQNRSASPQRLADSSCYGVQWRPD